MFRRYLALALPLAVYVLVGASPAPASSSSSFGFKSFSVAITNANGTPDTQAGSHPYAETYTFELNNASNPEGVLELAGGREIKDLNFNLAPGVIGDPNAIPQCTRQQFDSSSGCPASTIVGHDTVGLATGAKGGLTYLEDLDVYNMVPPAGTPAEFAFNQFSVHGIVDFAVRGPSSEGEGYGLVAHVYNVSQRSIVYNSFEVYGAGAEGKAAFLTLPTSCSGRPLKFSVTATSWQEPNAPPATDSAEAPGMAAGCGGFGFEPSLAALAPDTSHAETPAGLTAEVTVPEDPGLTSATEGRRDTDVQNATVTLPAGVTINPGQATGLQACQPSQEALEEPESPPSCPAASKVGTDSISTPLLKENLEGDVYVLQSNPPHLQLLVAASGEGVNLKLIGDVHLDPVTGQLTTTFSGTPQLPFTDLQAVLQRWGAGGTGHPGGVRRVHERRGFHAVEQPVHARFLLGQRLRDRLRHGWEPPVSVLAAAVQSGADRGLHDRSGGGVHRLLDAAPARRRSAAHRTAAVQDARGPSGHDLRRAAVRRTAGVAGDVSRRVTDRPHGR